MGNTFLQSCISGVQQQSSCRVIIAAGAPASGKGTLCEDLKQRYGLVHISPGQILRDHVQRRTELGLSVQPYIDKGQLAPSNLVLEAIQERISSPDVAIRGCVLDNFPLTSDQAKILVRHIWVARFILIDVPRDVLIARALGRRLDPLTGNIYHLTFRPPPQEVLPRLVHRTDDVESSVYVRLETYSRHISTILPFFRSCLCKVDGNKGAEEVAQYVARDLDSMEWDSPEAPYFGHIAFSGAFSAQEATRAGFYSPLNPPQVGERIVAFRRGDDRDKRGTIVDTELRVSDGSGGLKLGAEGVKVTVSADTGATFESWSAFLAPLNDMEYSSICTTRDFQSSNFARLLGGVTSVGDVYPTTNEAARASLKRWLENLVDADEEPIGMSPEALGNMMADFDSHADASLYLYSTQHKLGRRTSFNLGQDYSLYYRALNNTLNADTWDNLSNAMPLVRRMIYLLLYDEKDGRRRYHTGGRVWKGDMQRPVPLNMHKLREAHKLAKVVRFRQFQSTSSNEALADKYMKREENRGFKWIIDIPSEFWGARDIQDVAWKAHESETLFPPYSAFRVQSVDADRCHLVGVDRCLELDARALRHGLSGTSVELIGY